MVLLTIVTGAYKPTYNWGASHCTYDDPMIFKISHLFRGAFVMVDSGSSDGDSGIPLVGVARKPKGSPAGLQCLRGARDVVVLISHDLWRKYEVIYSYRSSMMGMMRWVKLPMNELTQ